jgi:hypothetical protein
MLSWQSIDTQNGESPMDGSQFDALPRFRTDACSRRAVLAAGGAAGRKRGMGTRRALLLAVAITVLGVLAALLGPVPEGEARSRLRTRTETISISTGCTSNDADGYCSPYSSGFVATRKVLRFEIIASPTHCTAVQVIIHLDDPDDNPMADYGPFTLAPGASTGTINVGNVPSGTYHIATSARDVPGGCDGPITGWGATIKVTKSVRVRR